MEDRKLCEKVPCCVIVVGGLLFDPGCKSTAYKENCTWFKFTKVLICRGVIQLVKAPDRGLETPLKIYIVLMETFH